MKTPSIISRICLGTVVAVLFLQVSASYAHKTTETEAGLVIVLGWLDEPTLTGIANAVEVEVTKGSAPVKDARLTAVVSFGNDATSPLDLVPLFEKPGTYTAPIIPTQPGAYTFEIKGTVGEIKGEAAGEPVAIKVQAGPNTFDEVRDSSGLSFPAINDGDQNKEAELIAAVAQLRADAATKEKLNIATLVLMLVILWLAISSSRSRRKANRKE